MNFSSNAITLRFNLIWLVLLVRSLEFCNLIARIVNYLTNYSFILITLRFLSPLKHKHSTFHHALKEAKILIHAAVAFVCLIIKLTVICFCWCCDGKKERGKGCLFKLIRNCLFFYFISASTFGRFLSRCFRARWLKKG